MTRISFYNLHGLAHRNFDEDHFDESLLPIQIAENLTLEDVSPMLNEQSFSWVASHIAPMDLADLQGAKFALVFRSEETDIHERRVADQVVHDAMACLRIIRPMRESIGFMSGSLQPDGQLNVQTFQHPRNLEVPEVEKLYSLRVADVHSLQEYLPVFRQAFSVDAFKFRMSVEFNQAAHFQDRYPKARLLLRCSALEALYTSTGREHKGKLVATERIKWFLGGLTPIYNPGDIPDYLEQPATSIADIVDFIYDLRNHIAHGSRIPEGLFKQFTREGVNGPVNGFSIADEAASAIARLSLQKIMRENLIEHFTSDRTAEAYFSAHDLVRSRLQRSRN